MITQDSLRFYKDHAVYPQFGGVVLDREEGKRIAKCLGNGKAAILQNHGLLTVGSTIDAAAFWFISLDKTCKKPPSAIRQVTNVDNITGHAQLLVDAAEQGSGHKKTFIPEEEAKFSFEQVGTPEKGWLAFQPYMDEILAKTNGSFLK